MKEINIHPIGPLTPYLCSYTGSDGARYSITLYATDESEVLANHPDLDDLTVDGVLHTILREDRE